MIQEQPACTLRMLALLLVMLALLPGGRSRGCLSQARFDNTPLRITISSPVPACLTLLVCRTAPELMRDDVLFVSRQAANC